MPAMLGCSTICPNCRHTFQCCPPVPCCQRSTAANRPPCCQVSAENRPPPCCHVSSAANRPPCCQVSASPLASAENELTRLSDTFRALHLSGWYYEDLTYDQSNALLKDTKVGTFLVRDSSDPRFIFTLSVQTERGPRSVRLSYVNSAFRLDSQPHLPMPSFGGIVELVEHYRKTRTKRDVWIDPEGKPIATICLARPLRKENCPANLKHLTRLAINKTLKESKLKFLKLGLPSFLVSYLAEYPYTV